MLGKGLESLIPPQNNQNQNNQNNSDLSNLIRDKNLNLQNNNQNNLAPNQANQNSQNTPNSNLNNGNDKKENDDLKNHLNSEKVINPIEPKTENVSEEKNQTEKKIEETEPKITKTEQETNTPKENNLISHSPNKSDFLKEKQTKKHSLKFEQAVFHIEVSKIKPNPQQPRRDFNEESIKELAASIRQFGIIQPLVVTKIEKEVPTGTEIEYQIIAGERRWLAAKYLGLETVPAIIKVVDVERERLELAVIENIQRENLNPIETARAFARLQDEFNLTQREIAARLGKSREAVANALRLLDLPKQIQDAIAEGKISESHGRLLLTIEDPGIQQKLFEDLLKSNLTTRELKHKINIVRIPKTKDETTAAKTQNFDPEIKIIEEKLRLTFGTPVKISRDGQSGKIIIEFYSDEELKNIISKLNPEN
jgi:ParB family chromosome partitioning protein